MTGYDNDYPQTISYVLHILRVEILKVMEYQAVFDVGNRVIAETSHKKNIKFRAASVFNTIQDALLYGGMAGSLTRIFDEQSESRKNMTDDKISLQRLVVLVRKNIDAGKYTKGFLLLALEVSEMYNDKILIDIRQRLKHLRDRRIAHRLNKRLEANISVDDARKLLNSNDNYWASMVGRGGNKLGF